jgi:hypothetical protein
MKINVCIFVMRGLGKVKLRKKENIRDNTRKLCKIRELVKCHFTAYPLGPLLQVHAGCFTHEHYIQMLL